MKFLDFIHQTKTQAFLAFTIVILGFAAVLFGHLSAAAESRILDMVYLAPSFYFIASKSGDKKDDVIAKLSQQPTVTANADNTNINVTDNKN